MKRKISIILISIILIIGVTNVVTATNQKVALITNKDIEANDSIKKLYNLGEGGLYFCETPSSVYEFWDEKNQYNIIYEKSSNSNKMGWITLSSNLEKIKEIEINRYLSIFGNASYKDGYLYVVYGGNDNTTTDKSNSNFATTVTIEVVKYDTNGKVISELPIQARDTSRMDKYNTSSSFIAFGTRYAFDAGNCDIAINDNIMKCVFAKEMYNGHQMSHAIYVDVNKMTLLNASSKSDYNEIGGYYFVNNSYFVSHSMAQRVIPTSDGQFLSVDRGDANPRAFSVAKTYKNASNTLYLNNYSMFHFRESSDVAYAYNSTQSNLGNIVEVSDGYILVSSSEKTLSLNYANDRYINESQNIFIQKYNKDFSNTGKTVKDMQMFNTSERKSESSRTDSKNKGELLLSKNGVTDYGVKWLTNYNNVTVLGTRAVKINDSKIVILWAECDLEKNSSNKLTTTGKMRYFYEIIDNNGNILNGPYQIQNGSLNDTIHYNYKDGYIYWSERSILDSNKFIINKLNINQTTEKAELKISESSKNITDSNITSFKLNATTNINTEITWKTSNGSVATVDNTGLVKIVGNGTAVITASLYRYGISEKCTVTVGYKCKKIDVAQSEIYLTKGSTKYVSVTITPDNAMIKKLDWQSSDSNIVSVDGTYSSGAVRISAKNNGTATLTGTTTDGSNISIKIKINVIIPIRSLTSYKSMKMDKGTSKSLEIEVGPTDATEKLTYESSNTQIATVDANGIVTAKSSGTVQITYKSNYYGIKGTAYVRVISPLISVSLNTNKLTLEKGKTSQLSVLYNPTDATDKDITWMTSSSLVATVDSTGKVTANREGTAVITARASNGKTATCTVTVPKTETQPVTPTVVPITGVTVSPTTVTIKKGASSSIKATITPNNTTQSKTITWSTSNSSIASVDSTGKVTAKGEGTAVITAKTSNGKTATCTVTVPKTETQPVTPSKAVPNVKYVTHVQNEGWQNYVQNGAMAGTSGKSYRLEGIKIKLENNEYGGGISYQTHVQDIGWQNYVQNDAMSGTSGKSLRLEGIRIKLTGEIANYYDVYYRVHCQNFGWMDWAKNGESAGSAGYSYRLEAIQICLVKKGGAAPGKTNNPFIQKYITYQTHIQDIGWQGNVKDGQTSGTSGRSLRLEGIKINLENQQYDGNIEYATHVQNIGWQNYVKNGTMSGTSGKSLRLEAIRIRLTGTMAQKYDVYYRVHCQNFGWMGWAKNGESAGSAGYSYRLEAIQICLVKKGETAPGSSTNCFVSK